MNEVGLIADMQARFKVVGTPTVLETGKDEKGVSWLSVNVFDADPTTLSAQRINIQYYVFNRGQANEEAYYQDRPPVKLKSELAKSGIVLEAAVDAIAEIG